MADFQEFLKGNLVTGLAIGVGAAVVAPLLAPALSTIARPLAKSAIKGGLVIFEKTRETVAELGEVFDDLVAEAKAELEAAAATAAAPPAAVVTAAANPGESVPNEPAGAEASTSTNSPGS